MPGDLPMAQGKNRLKEPIINQVNIYKKSLLEAGILVKEMIVFGSSTKNFTHRWNDIDVAVVSPLFGKNYHRELVRLMELRPDAAMDIEPHPFNPRDLVNEWDPLASEIKKYGIKV
ncbi:MAG: DNA polymerase, beta domain-containing protein [Candidatus Berkelbacteria bacterium Licking1014_2]|uniref:DNA polymerase, beta domain-containing protein n=1 Tax=Candidatus Berkelbacteria bacterium Licking1014_2 TaxID=2017146 RepID=A0A554LUY1_9BACT|nr:MAG: DNA polymerase, beta domain-containing protein [Candidatus Berkelbacteria bacterium Licking1014_2]